jgi:hypothetical protein
MQIGPAQIGGQVWFAGGKKRLAGDRPRVWPTEDNDSNDLAWCTCPDSGRAGWECYGATIVRLNSQLTVEVHVQAPVQSRAGDRPAAR